MVRSRRVRPALSVLIAVVGLVTSASRASAADEHRAVLDLIVNGVPHGQVYVELTGDQVWCEIAALEQAGIQHITGDRVTRGGHTLVRLQSLEPGIRFMVDESSFALQLTVSASMLGRTTVNLDITHPRDIEYRRIPSGFLNYGANLTTLGSNTATIEGGVSAHGALVTSTAFSTGDRVVRGQTALTIDDRDRMNRYVVGDVVATSGALGGTTQLAGVSVSRDYSLDPYFVRYPTIRLGGVLTTPSRVEVYVNDHLVRIEQLPPGEYQLNNLALPVGAANTRVVVRDAFGGQQEFNNSFYISGGVLARGLQQFAYSAGVERTLPFESSWEYGRPVVLGLHRVGVTDTLTAGGRFEWRDDLANGGPNLTMQLGHLGQLETIGAISRASGRTGYAGSLAYEYAARLGSLASAVRFTSDAYTTVSTLVAANHPRLEVAAMAAARLTARASLSASWQELNYDNGIQNARRASVGTSIGMGRRTTLMLSGSRVLFGGRWDTGAFAGLAIAFDSRDTVVVSGERDGGTNRLVADVQRSLPYGTGVGYRFQAASDAAGSASTLDGELSAQSSFGRYALRQMVVNQHPSTLLDVSGGLVFVGGSLHATRPLDDGFALVRVPDVPDVRTYLSNQEVGRTNRQGDLVVPGLLAYYGNKLSIADSDVPVDRDVQRSEAVVAPPFRGAALALFPAPRPWRVSGWIVMMLGAQVVNPENGLLRIAGPAGPIETVLGSDGAYYLEGLAPGDYRARLSIGDGSCAFTLHIPQSNAPVIRAGITTCVVESAAQPVPR